MKGEVYYSDYLELDKILHAQHPESAKEGNEAPDEMLFIIVHQAYELWFKQILYELNIIQKIFNQSNINDNGPDLQNATHRLKRIAAILRLIIGNFDILETMTPLDFLDFRNLLSPASGFQSYQFKIIEARLGLRFEDRFGKSYYTQALREGDLKNVKEEESHVSLLALVNHWLERMPFFDKSFWENKSENFFWNEYRNLYEKSLLEQEKQNLVHFEMLFADKDYPAERQLSQAANRSALFIMLYRDYPLLQQPFQLLNTLLDIDEFLSAWRYRHISMVQRMIGTRIGTGGSSGKDYLKAAADKHFIFRELAELNTFLIERKNLPHLPKKLEQKLGYDS
jgi:tryptophan 2,3-dioxygenase